MGTNQPWNSEDQLLLKTIKITWPISRCQELTVLFLHVAPQPPTALPLKAIAHWLLEMSSSLDMNSPLDMSSPFLQLLASKIKQTSFPPILFLDWLSSGKQPDLTSHNNSRIWRWRNHLGSTLSSAVSWLGQLEKSPSSFWVSVGPNLPKAAHGNTYLQGPLGGCKELTDTGYVEQCLAHGGRYIAVNYYRLQRDRKRVSQLRLPG